MSKAKRIKALERRVAELEFWGTHSTDHTLPISAESARSVVARRLGKRYECTLLTGSGGDFDVRVRDTKGEEFDVMLIPFFGLVTVFRATDQADSARAQFKAARRLRASRGCIEPLGHHNGTVCCCTPAENKANV